MPEEFPTDNGVGNVAQLQSLVNQLQVTGGGGTLLIPQAFTTIGAPGVNLWHAIGTVTIGNQQAGEWNNLILRGTSGNGGYLKQDSTDFLFYNNESQTQAGGGTYIADFSVRYSNGATAGAAFNYVAGQEHRSARLNLEGCPFGIVFNNILEGYTRDGKVEFQNVTNGVAVSVISSGQHQTACNQIVIDTWDILNDGGGKNNGNIGVLVTGCNHCSIINSNIQDVGGGAIVFSITSVTGNDTVHSVVHNCQTASPHVGCIFTDNGGSGLYDSRMSDSFVQTGNLNTDTTGVMQIGTVGNANNLIDTFFINGVNVTGSTANTPSGWAWDINSGTNIRIINSGAQGSGLGGIRIQGGTRIWLGFVDFCVQYQGKGQIQPLAMNIANCSHVDVVFCDGSGYASAAFTFGTGITDLRIWFTRGYNDLTTGVAAAVTVPNNVATSNLGIGATSYYGPARWLFSGGGTITSAKIANNPGMTGAVTLPVNIASSGLIVMPYEFIQVAYTGTLNVTVVGF